MSVARRVDYGGLALAPRQRDMLLPRRISGELRVKDANTLIARAM